MAKKTVIMCDNCGNVVWDEGAVHKLVLQRRMQVWTADLCTPCAKDLMESAKFVEKTRKRKVVAE